MSGKKELFARFGIASKGIVYIILSILTLLSALNAGGSQSGSKDAIEYLAKQNYSMILLSVIAIGLLGFVFWRFYQGFANPEGKDNDLKGIITRISYIASGIIYGLLSFYAVKLITGTKSGTSSSSTSSSLYENDILLWIVGLLIIAKGIYEIYRAYSKKYKEDLENTDLSASAQSKMLIWARFGYTMRGLVFLLSGFLTITVSGSKLSGKTDVFTYISSEFGKIPLIIITFGLLGYGVFMLVRSRYATLKI